MTKIEVSEDKEDALGYIKGLLLHKVRNEPTVGDQRVSTHATQVITAGSSYDFEYVVPDGDIFYFYSWAGTNHASTTYRLFIDDMIKEQLDAPVQGATSWQQTQVPPDLVNRTVKIRVTNNGSSSITCTVHFRGWRRRR